MINPDAAPDLYAALKLIRAVYETTAVKVVDLILVGAIDGNVVEFNRLGDEILRRADAAIAKAEGR